jgi:hypothetical protein
VTPALTSEAARLGAEGHALVAEGHAKLAEAARLRAHDVAAQTTSSAELIPVPIAAERAPTSVRVARSED